MFVLGLAGLAGTGKSTIAQYLASQYGFAPFSFSDALRNEVAAGYGQEDTDFLTDRRYKELPIEALALDMCEEQGFIETARPILAKAYPWTQGEVDTIPLSPRWIQQVWGTQYRRAQDPDYWVKKAAGLLQQVREAVVYPEHRPQLFVNDTIRFPNECEWVHGFEDSNVWHIHRDGAAPVSAHESENPLPVLDGERELWNNDSIQRLHYGVDLLMTTSARFVRVEPEEKTI